MITTDIAYLLGMIIGKGDIQRNNETTKIIINIPHKNLTIEGENTQASIKISILDITKRLKKIIGTEIDYNTENKNKAHIYFSKPNEDFLIQTINFHLENYVTWRDFRIPEKIFEGSIDIKKEFLRGLSDVTGHIRKSNVRFKNYEHRVYIEVMDNWDLVIDIANLMKSIDVPIETIRWGHPNIVDPNLRFYNKGQRNYKEHQIKIWADEFTTIGFNIEHKNTLLKKYSKQNKDEWNNFCREQINKFENNQKKKEIYIKLIDNLKEKHHRYYWETGQSKKIKPSHPDENQEKIHPTIRGQHFNSWKEISMKLGYMQNE